MKVNPFFKIICSIPIILIALYFIPFLGICLILFRFYVYANKKYYITPVILLVCGLLILIPSLVKYTFGLFKLTLGIPFLNDILSSGIYDKLLGYSKLLITVGIIFLIIAFLFKNLITKLLSKANEAIQKDLEKDYEIRKENDLKMQEKRERAKNTHVVHCPYCGSTNTLTEKMGTCKYCRKKIEYKTPD